MSAMRCILSLCVLCVLFACGTVVCEVSTSADVQQKPLPTASQQHDGHQLPQDPGAIKDGLPAERSLKNSPGTPTPPRPRGGEERGAARPQSKDHVSSRFRGSRERHRQSGHPSAHLPEGSQSDPHVLPHAGAKPWDLHKRGYEEQQSYCEREYGYSSPDEIEDCVENYFFFGEGPGVSGYQPQGFTHFGLPKKESNKFSFDDLTDEDALEEDDAEESDAKDLSAHNEVTTPTDDAGAKITTAPSSTGLPNATEGKEGVVEPLPQTPPNLGPAVEPAVEPAVVPTSSGKAPNLSDNFTSVGTFMESALGVGGLNNMGDSASQATFHFVVVKFFIAFAAVMVVFY